MAAVVDLVVPNCCSGSPSEGVFFGARTVAAAHRASPEQEQADGACGERVAKNAAYTPLRGRKVE